MKRLLFLAFLLLLFFKPAISVNPVDGELTGNYLLKSGNNTGAENRKNVLKIDPVKLILGGINLSYERVITHKTSINIRAKYHSLGFIERTIGDYSTSGDNYTFKLINKPDFYSFGVDAEYRFYLNRKNVSRGFYVAPYGRYLNYTAKFEGEYTGMISQKLTTINGEIKPTLTIKGVGAQIGVHWLLKNHVSIDWGIAGLELDRYNFGVSIKSDAINNALDQYASDLKNIVGGFNSFLVKKLTNIAIDRCLNPDVSFWMVGCKGFFTIGYSF